MSLVCFTNINGFLFMPKCMLVVLMTLKHVLLLLNTVSFAYIETPSIRYASISVVEQPHINSNNNDTIKIFIGLFSISCLRIQDHLL